MATVCANCGDPAPEGTPPAPKGKVWLCPPCDREVRIALNG